MSLESLERRIRAMNELHRVHPTSVPPRQARELYMDGCVALLALERERLSLKHRLSAARLEPAGEVEGELAALAAQSEELREQLVRLKGLVRALREVLELGHQGVANGRRRRDSSSG